MESQTRSYQEKREPVVRALDRMKGLTQEMKTALLRDAADFGKLLHVAWMEKKQLDEISTTRIDNLYSLARRPAHWAARSSARAAAATCFSTRLHQAQGGRRSRRAGARSSPSVPRGRPDDLVGRRHPEGAGGAGRERPAWFRPAADGAGAGSGAVAGELVGAAAGALRPLAMAALLAAALPAAVPPAAADGGCGPAHFLPAYSHNDYQNERPLAEALERGYRGVEADVYFRKGVFLLGHDPDGLDSTAPSRRAISIR